MKMLHSRFFVAWASVAAVLAIAMGVVYAMPQRQQLGQAIGASVYIVSLNDEGKPLARGSGTVLDPRGLILTNFHVVANEDESALCNSKGVVAVLITRDPRENAVPMYLARVLKYDPKIDIAAIQIISDLKGNKLSTPPTLPSITVGDSDTMEVGSPLTIVGYPGLGQDTVTVTTGLVAGFIKDENENALMKTDAEINPGNSGGTALDDAGELIGIPTFTSEGKERMGKIGLIRPVNLAKPLLANLSGSQTQPPRDAPQRRGVAPTPDDGDQTADDQNPAPRPENPLATPRRTGGTVEFVGFTDSAEARQTVETIPTGSQSIYAYFKYTGMAKNAPYASVWTLDGKAIDGTEHPNETWPFDAGDGMGQLYIQSQSALPDGEYAVQIKVSGKALGGKIQLGDGSAQPQQPKKPQRRAPKTAATVKLHGQVVSADTNEPIEGAVVMVLNPGILWKNADLNNRKHIFDVVRTDADGMFETNRALELDTAYGVGIASQGFEPAGGDGFTPRKFYESGSFIDMGVIGLKAAQ